MRYTDNIWETQKHNMGHSDISWANRQYIGHTNNMVYNHYLGHTKTLYVLHRDIAFMGHIAITWDTQTLYGKHRSIIWDTVILYGTQRYIEWNTQTLHGTQ